jgi:hypothetical protein
VKAYYIETYSNDMALGSENAALNDFSCRELSHYIHNEWPLYERWVEVESGKLTEVVLLLSKYASHREIGEKIKDSEISAA